MLSGSPFSFSKVERGVVVEALAGGLVQDVVEGVVVDACPLALRMLAQALLLGRRQHAVEAAQHGHGQHDALVLRRAVGAAQQVGDVPDEVGKLVMICS